jgi:transposase
MIRLASEGRANDEIAAALSIGRDVVSLWRKRFFQKRMAGLEERARPGRPRLFPPELVARLQRLRVRICDKTVWRWLHEDAIRP